MPRLLPATLLPLIVVGACQTSGPAPVIDLRARGLGDTTQALAYGRLGTLPSGPVYFRIVAFTQAPGGAIPSQQHVPGFVFMRDGIQRLTVQGQAPQDLHGGESVFIRSLAHVHLNPGTSTSHWDFLAIWPARARAAPLVDPTAVVAYQTPDLPQDVLPPGPYGQTLRLVTLERAGRTAAHLFGGLQAMFVLEGSVVLRAAGKPVRTLAAGDGVFHTADTRLQELNGSPTVTRFLELLTTADGRPFETYLSRPA
jgi:quercetin dioxygenase-like cupin family protein